ncbi:MAG: hypothetical protein KAT43_01265 [Nanoarchaeota archaeon]|nr:hypothetical protein [Nanoarchaeota archaeon]
MDNVRLAKNRFEVDFLPPYGKPEVTLTGEIATIAGIIFAAGLALTYLE